MKKVKSIIVEEVYCKTEKTHCIQYLCEEISDNNQKFEENYWRNNFKQLIKHNIIKAISLISGVLTIITFIVAIIK